MKTFGLAALVGLLLSGCLEVDHTITLYLAADGKTDFVALLDDVHSNESDPKKRVAEEKQFSTEIRAGKFAHEVFAKSGVKSLRQTLIRDKLPFVALVTGKFDDAAAPWKLLGFEGERTAAVEKADGGRKLVLRYPAGQTKIDDFPHALHVVRVDGVFAEAEGFLLSEDKRNASPDKAFLAKQIQTGKAFETSLRW